MQKAPKAAEVWHSLGRARMMLGDAAAAEPCFRRVTSLLPRDADGWANLGVSLSAQQRYADAVPAYQRAIALAVTPHPDIVHNLGSCLLQLGQYADAGRLYEELAKIKDTCDVWTLLGIALQAQDRYPEAMAAYQKAAVHDATGYTLNLNLGTCASVRGDPEAAARHAERALAARPGDDVALYNLGSALIDAGRIDEAILTLARSTLPQAVGGRLVAHNYLDPADPQRFRRAHEEAVQTWVATSASAQAAPAASAAAVGAIAGSDGAGPLRVGFVSPDLCLHPVAFFLEGLLANLSTERLAVFVYSDVQQEDDTTALLRALGHTWRDVRAFDDDSFAQLVANDGIDVLIDLAGHTPGNRLRAFARRLAPVQASYLGYGATTGLAKMDWLLADDFIAPPGSESHYRESVLRLGPVFATYTAPRVELEPAPAPRLVRGYPTFGSFAQLRKVSASTLRLWLAALRARPDARLRIMSKGLDSPALRKRFAAPFLDAGIAAERLELHGAASLTDYLAAHRDVDLILDTLPWSGHTTTLHALWMGVPTLTAAGATQIGRFGEMVMRAIGLDEFVVAADAAAFGEAAARLIDTSPHIGADRAALRARLLASPLVDHAALARRFEDACDAMVRPLSAAARREGASPWVSPLTGEAGAAA